MPEIVRKNIIVTGTARAGKTSFSMLLHKHYNYNIISIDDIVESLKYGFPQLGVSSDSDEATTKIIESFLIRYLKELSEGPLYGGGIRTVLDTTHIDVKHIANVISNNHYSERWQMIGFIAKGETPEEMFSRLRKYDNENDWTYFRTDEELINDCNYFVGRNDYFYNAFVANDIPFFITHPNRKKAFKAALDLLFRSPE